MPYYLDATSLALATAVYTDAALSVCAGDGVYSDGTITRVQTGCLLGPAKFCPSCGADCDTSYIYSGSDEGVFFTTINTGNQSGDIGAIILRFDAGTYVTGIKAVFDGITYNTLSSPVYGLATAPAGLPVYIGDEEKDCGVTNSGIVLKNYNWDITTGSYVYQGVTSGVSVLPSQVNTSIGAPGTCVMVIPKVSPTPSSLFVTVESPCGAPFNLYVGCPSVLPSINASQVGISSASVCGEDDSFVYYNAPVNGTGSILGLFDYIFLDAYGEVKAADGYYYSPSVLPSGYEWFLVSNGIVVQMGNCDWENYIIRRCATQEEIPASSSIALTIGDLVTVTDVAYMGCTFEVIGQTNDTAVLTVDAISPAGSCSDICVFYLVNNMTSSNQYGAYVSCEGVFTTFSIRPNTIQYICARSESITIDEGPSGVIVEFFDCNCTS